MKPWTKKILFIGLPVAVAVVGLLFLLPQSKVVESVKRQLADAFVYEYIPNQNIDVTTTEAYRQKDSIYNDFRKKYRFHYQTIGVGNFGDSSKMILISEPPPHLEIDSIHSVLSKFTHQLEVKRHRIGYDGSVSDIVIILSNATQENINRLIEGLSSELFLSNYKPYAEDLPIEKERVYYSNSNLDYQISLAEFDQWFIEDREQFIDIKDTAKRVDIPGLMSAQRQGVYFSEIPGFVVWVIDKTKDLSEQIQYIRPFTLDADLILGGISDSATLVIVGRERESSVYELPPLRVETILLLASVTEKELSQSLDINDFLAGKMGDGRDWCPTYLSKELENTEFGHLMTITDVLLKDWSESGTIQEAYYRYPSPGYFPFDRPLFKKLGLNELVYNWNTTDAMYAIDLENVTLYTLNRTGALPVSYFNSQDNSTSVGRNYERRAYNYFANLGNTDLVRVVQYTALYQMFMDNGIRYQGATYGAFPKNKPYLLLSPTKSLLNVFKNLTEEQINHISDSISRKHFMEIQKEKVLSQMAQDEARYQFQFSEEDQTNIFNRVLDQQKQELKNAFYRTKQLLNNLSERDFEKVAKQLAYPRGNTSYTQEHYQIMMKAREINMLMRMIGKNNLTLLGLDLQKIKDGFVGQLSKSSAKYMKTPSVIITYNDFYTTGGHNLSSRISRVKSMTHYKKSGGSSGSEAPVPADRPTNSPGGEAKPRTTAPVASTPTNRSTKPSGGSSPSTVAKKGQSASTAKTTATKPANTSTSRTQTRQRAAVISAAPRAKRGF